MQRKKFEVGDIIWEKETLCVVTTVIDNIYVYRPIPIGKYGGNETVGK